MTDISKALLDAATEEQELAAQADQQASAALRRAARRTRASAPAITCLETHPEPHVTLTQLMAYWAVNYRTVKKWIENGDLAAVVFAPRIIRIPTASARAFEARARRKPA